MAEFHESADRIGIEIVGDEARAGGEAVQLRVLGGASDQLRRAFHADHINTARRQCQGEIADPTEEIADTLAGLRVEKIPRALDQHAIDSRIHLREFGRTIA